MGLVHLYTGEGKGKTTAAMGLALRAMGHGMEVLIVQFQKGSFTGEVAVLEKCGAKILRNSRDYGFTWNMSAKERAAVTAENNKNLFAAEALAKNGEVNLLVLDEVAAVMKNGLIDRQAVERLVLNKPEALELVLTGRGAEEFLVEHSDYVTKMDCVRHPYTRGIGARPGIEY